jgi:ureidoglycolate hydrolase
METYILQSIAPLPLTAAAFQPFGQVVAACEEGSSFESEARLVLQNGTPRFYIMRLRDRGLKFHKITRHRRSTQCLGSLEGREWFLGVSAPSAAAVPELAAIVVFRIPGDCFVNLDVGTWHAGPYFEAETVDFYSLELADTNVVDHDTCNLLEHHGVEFEITSAIDSTSPEV